MLERFAQFSSTISSLYRDIQKIEKDEMDRRGYKGAFAQYLVILDRYPQGLTASQLCEHCDRDKAAVSRVMAEMESKGLVQRTGESYRARLLLTPLGKETAGFVAQRAQVAVQEAGKDLGEEERRTFYAALGSIASRLQVLSQEGLPGKEVMK